MKDHHRHEKENHDLMNDRKDEFVATLKARLDKWNAEIDELAAKARKAEAENREEYERGIRELQRKRDEASEKLDTIRDATGDAWLTLRDGADRIWNELGRTVQNAKDAFAKGLGGGS